MAKSRSRTPEQEASESPFTPEALDAATAAAEADRKLLEKVQARDADRQPEPEPEPTIADRFVGMANLLVKVRQDTRLGEATLTKLMETALQYHAWDYGRRQQEAQNPMAQFMAQQRESGGEGELVGPEPDEFISEAPDNVVPLNATTEEN